MLETTIADDELSATDDLPDPEEFPAEYQIAALALKLRKTLNNLKTEGFTFQKAETSDISTWGNNLKTFWDNMNLREYDFLSTGTTAVSADPVLAVEMLAAGLSGGGTAVLSLILHTMMSRLMGSRDNAVNVRGGEIISDAVADMAGVETILTEMKAEITALKTEVSDLETQLESLVVNAESIDRALTIPANGEPAQPLIDTIVQIKEAFDTFGLSEDGLQSKLEEVLTEFTINLISQYATQSLHFGAVPEED